MATRLEDVVTLIKSNPSAWALASEVPQLIDGLDDAAKRIQALEKAVKVLHKKGQSA